MFWSIPVDCRRGIYGIVFLGAVLFAQIGENSATRIDPKLDFKSEDQMDKYPELGINHKLYNVRVIVDAARPKARHMDAEVLSEVGDGVNGKNKKTVGFQTNITIEVSDEDGSNSSKGKEDPEEENASVPVFKGRRVENDKNRPESKLYFDYSGSSETPIFPQTDDDSFRNLNWFYFQPPSAGYWTTARPRTEDNFIPYGIGFRPSPSPTPYPYPDYLRVKPCLCKFHDRPSVPNRRPAPHYHLSEEVYYSRGRSASDQFGGSSTSTGIDDKLEFPFHA